MHKNESDSPFFSFYVYSKKSTIHVQKNEQESWLLHIFSFNHCFYIWKWFYIVNNTIFDSNFVYLYFHCKCLTCTSALLGTPRSILMDDLGISQYGMKTIRYGVTQTKSSIFVGLSSELSMFIFLFNFYRVTIYKYILTKKYNHLLLFLCK